MKKHPEKYWLGSMFVLLAIFLVALYGKVDIPSRNVPSFQTKKLTINKSKEKRASSVTHFSETKEKQQATAVRTATSD